MSIGEVCIVCCRSKYHISVVSLFSCASWSCPCAGVYELCTWKLCACVMLLLLGPSAQQTADGSFRYWLPAPAFCWAHGANPLQSCKHLTVSIVGFMTVDWPCIQACMKLHVHDQFEVAISMLQVSLSHMTAEGPAWHACLLIPCLFYSVA